MEYMVFILILSLVWYTNFDINFLVQFSNFKRKTRAKVAVFWVCLIGSRGKYNVKIK